MAATGWCAVQGAGETADASASARPLVSSRTHSKSDKDVQAGLSLLVHTTDCRLSIPVLLIQGAVQGAGETAEASAPSRPLVSSRTHSKSDEDVRAGLSKPPLQRWVMQAHDAAPTLGSSSSAEAWRQSRE